MTVLRVVVPNDLDAGSSLHVDVAGKVIEVICPQNVKQGEIIEVDTGIQDDMTLPTVTASLVPDNNPANHSINAKPLSNTKVLGKVISTDPKIPVQVPNPVVIATSAPPTRLSTVANSTTGGFKYDLCSCMDGKTCCQALWWNTWCLQCIPVAQLLNRFRWNAFVISSNQSRAVTFAIVLIIYVIFLIGNIVFKATFQCDSTTNYYYDDYYFYAYSYSDCYPSVVGWIFGVVSMVALLYITILLVRIRIKFRDHYNIRGNCCADCCTVWWCSCCSIMQMLRQTHNEEEHRYSCCNCLTGLLEDAPEIV